MAEAGREELVMSHGGESVGWGTGEDLKGAGAGQKVKPQCGVAFSTC